MKITTEQDRAHLRLMQQLPVRTHQAPEPQSRNNFADYQRARRMNEVQSRRNTWLPGIYEKQEA
jgi:hypothetical protein